MLARGSGFRKKIPKNAFCKLFFAIPLCFMSTGRFTFVFFASALTQCCPSIARYKRKRVTQSSVVRISFALRAPDSRENG